MRPLAEFPRAARERIRFVLTDIDGTVTDGPRLPAAAYDAVEQLDGAGIGVIPVTAAPAGWCDLIARMWPVAAVIGENGGLCFHPERDAGTMVRRYWLGDAARAEARHRLGALGAQVKATLPAAEIAHDQCYRETTLAFVNPGDAMLRDRIIAMLHDARARTTVNSVWVLGWFGEFDKLAMARRMMAELFAIDIESAADTIVYVGDSLNDEPMFGFFPHSVGVATVRDYADRLAALPKWVATGGGGAGFVEVAEMLLGG